MGQSGKRLAWRSHVRQCIRSETSLANKPARIPNRLVLNMFGTRRNSLAAAGMATLAAASSAQAATVTVEVNAVLTTTSGNTAYDLDGDGTDDLNLEYDRGLGVRILFARETKSSPLTGLSNSLLVTGGSVPTDFDDLSGQEDFVHFFSGLGPDDPIDAGLFSSLPNSGFLGIRFPSFGGGAQFLEAWLEFSATGTTVSTAVLTFERYGYEDSGDSIAIGDTGSTPVPIPATGLLLASGIAAFGAVGYSRRRKRG